MNLPKKLALPLYSLFLVLFALSPFYFLNKYLNTPNSTPQSGAVLGDTSCSCNCNGTPGNYTSKWCGSKGSAGYQEIGGTCYAIEGQCNAEATDGGNSCNKDHYYTEKGAEASADKCGGNGGGGGGTCSINSCADAGGKVCNFGVPTSCNGMSPGLCETHRGSDCHWTGSSCTCDPNQGNVGGDGECGYKITYSDSHACGGGNSASLTATITKNNPAKCNQAVTVNINAGSFSCPGKEYADGTCRTCGGGSGATPVTIPANESSKTYGVSCQVQNNCGSCQVDINGTGTLVYDNSGCKDNPPPPPPAEVSIGGKAYCVIKTTGQKEYKPGIKINFEGQDTYGSTTDQNGNWTYKASSDFFQNKPIRPRGNANFPHASATDESSGVNNGIGCEDSNVEGTTYNPNNNTITESVGCKRTLPAKEVNFNLGYCPIPDCTGLTGPKELIVGQPGTYTVSFNKSVPNAKVTGVGISVINGSLSQGTAQCDINGQKPVSYQTQDANLNTSSNSFEWTPKVKGTYSVYGRIWNNATTECKAACIDGPPRYECQGAISCRTDITVKEPEVPMPKFSCNELKMSFENASGPILYNESNPNIPKGYKGNIILTCKASSDSTTKIDKIKFQLSKGGAIVQTGESTDVKETTTSGESTRKFEATYKFPTDGKGTYEAESLACITFQSKEFCK